MVPEEKQTKRKPTFEKIKKNTLITKDKVQKQLRSSKIHFPSYQISLLAKIN